MMLNESTSTPCNEKSLAFSVLGACREEIAPPETVTLQATPFPSPERNVVSDAADACCESELTYLPVLTDGT